MNAPAMVDARGLSCPQPVLLFHKYLRDGHNNMDILVDNTTSRENVTRAAASKGLSVRETLESDGAWRLEIRA